MTPLENIRLINKVLKDKHHELEYGGYTFMAKMGREDRKGRIYVEGEGLIPLTHPDQIFPLYVFNSEGDLASAEEVEELFY